MDLARETQGQPPLMGGTEAMTSLDLNALSAEDTEAPAATKRSNKVAESPFPGWVRETFDNGMAKAITVPAAQVGEVRYAIRTAGKLTGLGTRIVMTDRDGKPLDWYSGEGQAYVVRVQPDGTPREVPQNTNVRVTFKGQEKRQRKLKGDVQPADGVETDEDEEYGDEG